MIEIRKMHKDDLKNVLKWRNSNIVRQSMLNKEIIKWDEHLKWFEKCQNDDRITNLIVDKDKKTIGVVNIMAIDIESKSCSWSIYLAEEQGKGLGTAMGFAVIDYIKNILKLKKIYVQVLKENLISVAFHRKIGFSLINKTSINVKERSVDIFNMELNID